jgi:pSer/pThr/pTyr-binding forkhead associated (FHA) protein
MDPFLEACGASGPLVLAIEDHDGPADVHRILPQPFVLIGRDPRADLVLEHPRVSRRHAYIQMIAGRLFCLDMGSRTGTLWGEGLGQAGWMSRRYPIRIGPFSIRAHDVELQEGEEDPKNPLTARSLAGERLPDVALEFLNADTGPTTWPMNRVMALVGSAPGCRPRLKHPSVSRVHCALVRSPAGTWVVDLLGREGLSANGRVVRAHPLAEGDDLRMGRFAIRVHLGIPVDSRTGSEGELEVRLTTPELSRPQSRAMRSLPAASAPDPNTKGPLVPYIPPVPSPPPVASTGRWRPTAPGEDLSLGTLEPALPRGADPLLVQLASQFGVMQQQMLDQFQQAMMMMLQMFGNLQRDQMERAQGEIDELRRLTQELQTLQAESVRQAASPMDRATGPRSTSQTSPEALSAKPGPAEVAMPPGPALEPSQRALSREGASADAGGPEPKRATPRAVERGDPAERAPAGPDIHWELSRRIAELQEERQNRWQRLFALVAGSARGGSTP